MGRLNSLVFLSAALVMIAAATPSKTLGAVPNPIVEGPVSGGLRGRPWQSSLVDVTPYGYVEEEYFISGVAHNYGVVAVALTSQQTSLAVAAPYKTRIIIRRPVDPARFDGTVAVEWLNVTNQSDLETVWPVTYPLILREGAAYVGVSAQLAGVCCGPASLKIWDPDRYGTLVHPGDSFSWDIFSQAIQALRRPLENRTTILDPAVVDPMGGLTVERVIATGASQSAGFLTTYVNNPAFHKTARVVDAFVIARGGGPYPDLDTPVLQLNEEGNFSTRQEDSPFFRLWEEAGTAHAPAAWWNYVWATLSRDVAGTPLPNAVNIACSVNRGSINYSSDAAAYWVEQWLTNGTPPPIAPRLATDASGNVVRDSNGLAVGGLRHPFIQVPLALNYAADNAGAPAGCPLFGSYQPWSREKILSLYPTKDDYVSKVDDWVDSEVAAGFLIPEDAADAKTKAQAFDVWSEGTCYDTLNALGNETGPISSALHGPTYDTIEPEIGLGAAPAVRDASCNVLVPLGL